MKSWKKPTDETIEKALASVKKEIDRQYFFSRLKNPFWIKPLEQRGFFKSPPKIKHLPDGYMQYPFWPELQYLKNVCEEVPQDVVDIILDIPDTENPRVYDDIIDIASRLSGPLSVMLKSKIIGYTQSKYHFVFHRFKPLLLYWARIGQTDAALDLAKVLIPFRPDPKSEDKQARRRENPADWTSSLEPVPPCNQWEYQQLLENGVRFLADKAPFPIARILIDATANMICLKHHRDELDKGVRDDFSESWCRRLNEPDKAHQNPKETLVYTLTYACEQVYNRSSDSIDSLDEILRNQPWGIFRRVRQHLYGIHPNEQTKPWIRESILAHKDYAEWDYHFEFQRMVRSACEILGSTLLTEVERTRIFDAILSGPSQSSFREWMGERYTEKSFIERQRYFHRKQLTPFAAVLFGKYTEYFQQLLAEDKKPITDKDYSPVGEVRSGTVSYRSPKSLEELSKLTDEELLAFINLWQSAHRDENDWLIEINIDALAGVFKSVFKDAIIPNSLRLRFWMENLERIARPVYVRTMVQAIQETIKEQNFEKLDQWFSLCKWILSNPDLGRQSSEESSETPDWGSSRRAVGDFVGVCLEKDVHTPLAAREGLAVLLELLCSQFDWRLDRDKPVILNRNDQLTEAINNTRSRALEDLLDFGYWVRRQSKDALVEVPEVMRILEKRIKPNGGHPLTLAEYAILGLNYGRVCDLNKNWAIQYKPVFFPRDNFRIWLESFGNFIRFNLPSGYVLDVFRDDIVFALETLGNLKAGEEIGRELTDALGQHLFTYYLWDDFPLVGPESLLERFYQRTKNDKVSWSRLFDHVGRLLKNSGKQLDEGLKQRIAAFLDWRIAQKDSTELKEFTFWLEAECLDGEWRLKSFLRTLEYSNSEDVGVSIQLDALSEMLKEHTALVVECFAKLTDLATRNGTSDFIQADKAKPILKSGLESEDPKVREKAEIARENLLRGSRFEFLNMDE